MPNEIGTMTDFKYTPGYFSNCNGEKINNASTNPALGLATPHRHSRNRLKKSFSECEYDDMDPDFVMSSPSKRRYPEQGQSLPRSAINKHNSFTVSDGMTETKLQYQQDQMKSQYLLQQQQKLKEFKNDPNYNNTDNYSSESSNDNRCGKSQNRANNNNINNSGKNVGSGTNSNTNSLRRKKGLSTLSLCSCDADTEVIPGQSRPLYQYSLDRKKPLHTYTCEQNAQILLRLEKERQKKYGSFGRLHFATGAANETLSKEKDNVEYPSMYPENNFTEDDIDDNIPPPPNPPLKRNLSFNKSHQQISIPTILGNQNTNEEYKVNTFEMPSNKPDLFNFATKTAIDSGNKLIVDGMSTTTDANNLGNNCPNKAAYPLYCFDENYHQQCEKENIKSLYLYHHEPLGYLPNYDNISSNNKIPEKYNTIDCGGVPIHYTMPPPHNNKFHSSTCNLSSQFNSSNLINGHHFSNSLNNFNLINPHQQMQNFYNLNPSYNQLHTQLTPEGITNIGGMPGPYGSSSMLGSSFASNISLNGTPKQSQNMPWKHRQCSSRSSSSGTNSSRWDLPSRQWLALTSILLIAGAASVAVPLALSVTANAPLEERLQAAIQILDTVPLIDGHNDLPWNIRKFLHNQINDFKFDEDLRTVLPWSKSQWSQTDLLRLKRGRISAQFWAAYVPCEAQYKDAVQITLEQIDVINRLTEKFSPQMTKCTSVYDIREAHKNRQICSLIGVEGGHSLGGSLGVLRIYYSLGVRYMTLTSTCNTPWADSSNADPPKFDVKHGGLTAYGKTIVREMNRLGMIVDLSKTSVNTMRDVLAISEGPVIFSHSSAFDLCNSSRNVQDEILDLVGKNRGLVMINFYSKYLSCSENATVYDAIAHINHIKRVAGINSVGLGAGFDGINFTPKGLQDVSAYPMLFAELLADGWTLEELTRLAGGNLLRVLSEVERVRDAKKLNNEKPYEDLPNFRLPLATSEEVFNCSSNSL